MADDKSKQVQKTNQNGRPTLVLKREHLEKTAELAETTSDWLGHLTSGAQVWRADTFSWGILNSPSAPMFSRAWLNQVKRFRLYNYNPETGRVFQGNRYTQVTNIGKALEETDKKLGVAGNAIAITEIALASHKKDAKTVAEKSTTLILTTAAETADAKVVGKCIDIAARRLDPKRMAVAGAACLAAWKYGASKASEWTGKQVSETDEGVKVATAFMKAIDNMDEQDKAAEEKRKQREIKKEPMREWQIQSSD